MGRSPSQAWKRNISGNRGTASLIGGIGGVVLALLVRFFAGGPWTILHRLGAGEILPPLWFLSLLWLSWFFLVGFATGYLLATEVGGAPREVLLWRGMTCLVLTLVLALVWYTLLFGKFSLFFSWLCLPLALAAALLCAISWWSLCRGAAVVLIGYALWLLCLFLLQMAVMLHN